MSNRKKRKGCLLKLFRYTAVFLLTACLSACAWGRLPETILPQENEPYIEPAELSSSEAEIPASQEGSESSSEENISEEPVSEEVTASSDEEPTTGSDTAPSEEETSEEETSEEIPEDPGPTFFGHPMAEDLVQLNEATLNRQGSMLFDVTRSDITFTAGEVLDKILAYSLPETAYYGNVPPDDVLKNQLLQKRNLGFLSQDPGQLILPEYGILTENADVRGFPTDLAAADSQDPMAFDMFQETVLNYGCGVLVLHYTEDRSYAFVQGYNYAGWVKTSAIGFTDQETFLEFLCSPRFLICTWPDLADPLNRLGTILPYKAHFGTYYLVSYPETGADGRLVLKEQPFNTAASTSSWSDGFLAWSDDEFVRRALKLTGFPYRWADKDNFYDCSSTGQLLYLLFGIYVPRNTSWMPAFGGNVVEGSGADFVYSTLEGHTGALLLMPGHLMIYLGKTEDGRHKTLHNTIDFQAWSAVIEYLENNCSTGRPYADLITYILYK